MKKEEFRLTLELLPQAAWHNDLSNTLSKNDWDLIRKKCYEKANGRCQICDYQTTELDAHEIWEFDTRAHTQTLKNIIAICTKCHGVKHFRNSVRMGYGEEVKNHFIQVNKCTELDFNNHLLEEMLKYDERNKIYRWKMIANLSLFGNITKRDKFIPIISSPYNNIEWNKIDYVVFNKLFIKTKNQNSILNPHINSIEVNNYQGLITIESSFSDKIDWYLDEVKIKTKYNVSGVFKTSLSVENLNGKSLYFIISKGKEFIKSLPFYLQSY